MAAKALNKNNSAVKRIMQEAKELANDPSTDYSAAPLEDDIFEWHCTLRGPAGTDFEGGLYHFRILLPAEYPFRPPSLMMLTPNGRFELNTKICISFTNYHEELWQPAWGVRTAILGLQGFFPLKGQQAVGVGSIEYPPAERKRLAALSREWVCPHCKESNLALLPDPPAASDGSFSATALPLTVALGATASETASPVTSAETPSGEPGPAHTPLSPTPEVTAEPDLAAMHSIDTLMPSGNAAAAGTGPVHRRTAPFIARAAVETPGVAAAPDARRRAHKPPLLLVDGAICVLFVIAFAIICRRMV
ncbi:putative UBC-like protein [Lyophyllum shimeji]|uniref:UBC-like protein n=1 Tax=Lyophyllum shimeji TaxID=47721 RepID=A0A9P3PH01_LYOSH|nr:putative UBC-like protein [Lyophyllum shimeji]